MKSGIYKIESRASKNFYIGSAVDVVSRWRQHRHHLNKGTHHSPALQNAWEKYGGDFFEFTVLLYCDKQNLIFFEQRAIDVALPEYNICKIAGSTLGRRASEATRAKLSARVWSAESREKARVASLGNTSRRGKTGKLSAVRSGKPLTKEHKSNIRIANTGHAVSEETKAKISRALQGNTNAKGAVVTESTRAKISAKMKGRVFTAETIAKMKASRNSRLPASEETRAKMSNSQKRRYASCTQRV